MPSSASPASPQAARRILAVGAHPDDVEFGCGGILAKEAARGHAITVLNLSRGESGSRGAAEEREREAAAAASRMGARVLGAEIGVSYAMAVWANDPIRLEGITDLAGSGRRF